MTMKRDERLKRDEALDGLKRREAQRVPVLVTGGGHPPRIVRHAKELPPEPGEDYEGPEMEYHRVRDDRGNWTRAGLEHAIRAGGGVMHHGQIITRLDDLPEAEELDAAGAAHLDAQAAKLDSEMAKLGAQRAHLERQREEMREKARAGARTARERTQDRHAAAAADEAAQSGDAGPAGPPHATGVTAVSLGQAGQPGPGGHGQAGHGHAAGHGQAGHGQAGHGHAGGAAAKDKDKDKK